MNEILKFKKSREIPKADGGIKTERRTPGGQVIYDTLEQGEGFFTKLGRWFTTPLSTGTTPGGQAYSISEPASKVNTNELDKTAMAAKTHRTLDEMRRNHYGSLENYNKAVNGTPSNVSKPAAKPVVKSATDWGKEFTNFMGGLSSEQQEWLRKNGLQDATKLQDYLTNMGFGVGKFGSDGKFGKDSKAAWAQFAASGIMGRNRDQEILKRQLEELKKPEPVIDAPDPFGYKTTNTYEGNDFASKLKGMGIRSNADLINFMHNSGKEGWKGDTWQTQFRSDVDRALGGDYSDANIRKVFGTQGKWGRGFLGRGDFGDFQNALQTNAGVWNGMYDRKESKARMDAGRQQLAAKMAQQYTELNPVQLTASKKFTIGNGVGANTLGEAGQGSMGGNDWMKFAVLSGYLPKQEETSAPQQEDWMKYALQTGYLPL